MRHVVRFIEIGREAPHKLSVSLGYEEVEEVEDEDSSKEYYVRNGLPFLYAKLLISSSSTSSSSSNIIYIYIIFLHILFTKNKCETIELKEWNINNILQDVQKTIKNNLLKQNTKPPPVRLPYSAQPWRHDHSMVAENNSPALF
jgi:hypothetical protein